MASKFHSRLVGTIILVAAGVIILPDLLDGTKEHYQEELAAIPIKPEVATQQQSFDVLEPITVDVALPESPVQITEVAPTPPLNENEQGSAQIDANNSGDILVSPVEVVELNQFESSAWIIQLMALKNVENAEKLVEDLKKRGYQAHTKQENSFTRVIVGPDTSKEKLEKQIKELEEITGSKGQLMTFKPLNP